MSSIERVGLRRFTGGCRPADAPSWQYWVGVTKGGKRGYFNPVDCVPVQPESSPLISRQTKSLQPPPKSQYSLRLLSGSDESCRLQLFYCTTSFVNLM